MFFSCLKGIVFVTANGSPNYYLKKVLERILFDESAEPKALSLSLLEHITNSFSDDKEIGCGGFATVYKKMLDNGTVAVKKLCNMVDMDEKKFSEEIRWEMVDYQGKLVLADVRQKLLCFEYLPKGSLDKHITASRSTMEWLAGLRCHANINGICDGLYYLHQNHIVHLDLKPVNILLDDNMLPKIADFGLSRCFDEKQSQAITSKLIGTIGYLAPEFYTRRQITLKLDIYSLGMIIIEILTGDRGYADIDNALERWRSRLEKSLGDKQLVQVRVYTEIAIECANLNPAKRLHIQHIIDRLGATRNADEFATETGASSSSSQRYGHSAAVAPGPTIAPENTMANELKKLTEELYDMTNQNQHVSLMSGDNSNVQQETDIEETSSNVEESLIIGRTEERDNIVATLSGSISLEFTVLPIYGFGGIGKTTLAQLVFNDAQFAGYSKVWVYVSQNLVLNKIGNSIISQLSEESHVAERQMIHIKLRELLAGKKILIVLDDVWEKNPDTLKSLMAMLRVGAGSMVTVIVTTRDEAIAREICHTVKLTKKQLKHIGREIATKCGGVALAAQSLGYTLKGKTFDEWESVRDNYIWNASILEESSSRDHEVLAPLLISYTHMPEWLKLCFTYCAVFAKGHNIVKYDLIHQWIALGFNEWSRIFDSMQLCEKYVTQLLGMSFLQYAKPPMNDRRRDKDVTVFTMHDLVHDLARAILDDQVNDNGSVVGNRCLYAFLTDCSKPLQLSMTSPANIKVLHFLDCGKLELRGNAFSLGTRLCVLDLSECLVRKFPESVGQLKQLRFLCAPRIRDQMIPNCITKLSELNYLNLRGSHNLSALPESIGDMKGLMHLDLSGCHGIRKLPKSFAELKQLVHLDLSRCYMSISEAFGGLTELQYLDLSVQFIIVANRRGLTEVIGNLTKLRYLNLSGCMHAMAQSKDQIDSLLGSVSTLSNLEHLNLSENRGLSSIPESFGNLRKLHTLDLVGCSNIEKLPDSMFQIVNLKLLNVDNFVKSGLSWLNVALLPHFVVHPSSDKSSSNITLLQPTNPDMLTIDRLENVKSAEEAESIELIKKQKIKMLAFQWTVAAVRFVDDQEVLEKLVPPSSAQILSITGYRSVSIPDWFMDIGYYLPNLCKINLCDFPKCKSLPPLCQLPNLLEMGLYGMESLEEFNTAYTRGEGGANELMFPKLEALTVERCEKLRIQPCLPRDISVLMIIDCDNVLLSLGESLSHSAASSRPITDLTVCSSKVPLQQGAPRKLTIGRCSDLTTSTEIIQHLSSLESLPLDQAKLRKLSLSTGRSMTSLPQWLGDLTSLKNFGIIYCEGIRTLPDSMIQLTKLEHLTISGCPMLLKWCKSEENMIKLAHIGLKKPICGLLSIYVLSYMHFPCSTGGAGL
ncbi:hypothetical protein VPH35_134958 [Triticum aestivum]